MFLRPKVSLNGDSAEIYMHFLSDQRITNCNYKNYKLNYKN